MSEGESPFPAEMQAQMGHRRKAHRGHRSRGKGPKPAAGTDHMAAANAALKAAHDDPTPKGTMAHLFKALSSLKKC